MFFVEPNELHRDYVFYMQAIYWQQYPWALGEVTCKARSLISEMTGYASVLTILAFSMERYLAICHPLYQYAMAGFSRAVKVRCNMNFHFETKRFLSDYCTGLGGFFSLRVALCVLHKAELHPPAP